MFDWNPRPPRQLRIQQRYFPEDTVTHDGCLYIVTDTILGEGEIEFRYRLRQENSSETLICFDSQIQGIASKGPRHEGTHTVRATMPDCEGPQHPSSDSPDDKFRQIMKRKASMLLPADAAMESHEQSEFLDSLIIGDSLRAVVATMKNCPEIFAKRFPWVLQLLKENHSVEDVSDWLLKSENVHWLYRPPGSIMYQGWREKGVWKHLPNCIHSICDTIVPSERINDKKANSDTEGESKLSLTQGNTRNFAQASTKPVNASNALPDIEDHTSRPDIREERLAKICGAGAAHPPTSRHDDFIGFLVVKGSAVEVSHGYDGDHEEQFRRDKRLSAAARDLETAVEALWLRQGCCTYFSIITRDSLRPNVACVSRVHYKDVRKLRELQGAYPYNPTEINKDQLGSLARKCQEIFDSLQMGWVAESYLTSSDGQPLIPDLDRCTHLCALIVQMCSVALVTYSRGHSRPFTHPHLSRSIETFKFTGTGTKGPTVGATRVTLESLEQTLQRPVWLFYPVSESESGIAVKSKFMLSTRVDDLLDLWHGRIERSSAPNGVEIYLGGGKLSSTSCDTATQAEKPCRWSPDAEGDVKASTFNVNDVLLIGEEQLMPRL